MSNPIDDYMKGTKAIPLPPNSQQEAELYNSENEKAIEGQTEAQTKLAIEINKDLENAERKRRHDDEKELYESNQREAESEMNREMEYNSQRELDDIDQSAPDSNNDNYLEDSEFGGNYFSQPDESEQKESLGNRIRAKYDSFKASASDTAENLSSSFGESFGGASAKANATYSRFKRGDPIFSVQQPAKRGKNPYTRSVSRPGRSISRPYSGGRFGGDEFTLGANGANPYYPVVNSGQQSVSPQPTMDMYLPSGGAAYEGEFSNFNARTEFKNSKYANTKEDTYDPFGFGIGGKLSADGFDNMSGFGDSLLGGVGNSQESSIFGGMSAGTDTVFGDGAMFNAPRGKAKKESSGFGLDMIIGDSGGMYNTSDPSPRKPTNKRKSARKTAKKVSKAKPTKRRPTTRKQTYNGFTLP